MTTINNAVLNSYKLLLQKAELVALDDCQLKDLLSNASRRNVRTMFEFSLDHIKAAFGYLGIDIREGSKGWGDKRKKSTFIKMAIQSLSVLHFDDIDKAVNKLSFALGIQDGSLEEDERAILDALEKAENNAKLEQAINAVDGAIQTVQATAKKVTKAELKLQRQMLLNRLPPEVKWKSDFMGEVTIGKEVREFWVTEPYTSPVVNLATSSGMAIMSNWHSTVENSFMRAAVRAFHDLIAERGKPALIENRLLALTGLMASNKKRADWYAQSAEVLVLADGQRMESREGGQYLYVLNPIESVDLNEGTAYLKSQHIARTYPDRYDYVEGFALVGQKLIHHAWVFDKRHNKAVEITFKDPDIQHFGIVLEIGWIDKVIASRLKDDSISPCFSQSIVEGNFFDDFALLKSGVTPTW
jgi:hypothetical protein